MRRAIAAADSLIALAMACVLASPEHSHLLGLPHPPHHTLQSSLLPAILFGISLGSFSELVWTNAGLGTGAAIAVRSSSAACLLRWVGTSDDENFVAQRGRLIILTTSCCLVLLSCVQLFLVGKRLLRRGIGGGAGGGGSGSGTAAAAAAPMPTHFLSIRATNPELVQNLLDMQNEIVKREPAMEHALIPAAQFHVTLAGLVLRDEEAKKRAVGAMGEVQRVAREMLPKRPQLHISGVGSFRNNVLFAKVRETEDVAALAKLAVRATQIFASAGVTVPDDGKLGLRMTILKLAKLQRAVKTRRVGRVREIDPSLYADYVEKDFGTQDVDNIDLCAVKNKERDGYFLREESISAHNE